MLPNLQSPTGADHWLKKQKSESGDAVHRVSLPRVRGGLRRAKVDLRDGQWRVTNISITLRIFKASYQYSFKNKV